MKLDKLIKDIKIKEIVGNPNIEISNLSQDTREDFLENTAYFAIAGTQIDGHIFIESAVEKSAVAIFCEQKPEHIDESVTYILLENINEKMGYIVSNFYNKPSEKLKIIAITGTNGKTTIATSLYNCFLTLEKSAALFSTAGDFINGEEFVSNKKASSSMEIIEFQKSLAYAVRQGCEYVCIEATSHALDQYRLNGTKITGSIYTNLSQDHLDYHPNFDHYAQSKKRLFDMLSRGSFTLVNIDDPYGVFMVSDTKSKIISYGDKNFSNKITRDLVFDVRGFGITGTQVIFNTHLAEVNFIGTFNMYNLISIYGALIELDFEKDLILDVLSTIKGAPGRMEIITGNREGVVAIVDYAHSPDALKNVLTTLSDLPHSRIITVVGVGGDRDREKRPQMARIAQEGSSYTIFTSDNPRTEDLNQIFSDLLVGCNKDIHNYKEIRDRESAIKEAINMSNSGDIILVAGKGHEDYQIIGTEKHHFDDKEVVEKYLQKKGLNN